MDSVEIDFLVNVSKRFYHGGETQAAIARALGVDPSTISRALRKARDEGIVRIDIQRPRRIDVDLARELSDRFALGRAVVVTDDGSNTAVAAAAAEYLASRLTNGARLGMSFGRLPSAVIHALPAGIVSGLEISMILGGFSRAGTGIQGHELARHVASLYPGSHVHYLQAPLLVDSPDIKQAMLRDSSIQASLKAAANSEMALVGIGHLTDSAPLVRYGHLSAGDRRRLLEAGAVGDIGARYFTLSGLPVTEIDDRLMAVERDVLQRIPTILAVAAGPEKYEAIRGALRTGFVDVLVTDEGTAREVLAAEAREPGYVREGQAS